MPSDNDLTAAVTANVKCADTGPVNCADLQFVMTVTFKRLAAMAQTLLKAGDKGAADYNHNIELEHSLTNLTLEIAGAQDTDADAAVSDIATRVKIEGGQLKRFGDGENQRLAIGNYEITVEAEALNSQTGFLGTLPVVITAEILGLGGAGQRGGGPRGDLVRGGGTRRGFGACDYGERGLCAEQCGG